jgi:hypothetical protein
MQTERELRVYPMLEDDVYKDMARIPEQHRKPIKEGSICKVSFGDHTKYLIVRGAPEQLGNGIMLDELTRNALEVQSGMTYTFRIKHAGPFEQIKWACTLADAGPRIAAWLAVVSVILGIVGLGLGILGIVISVHC